MRRDEGSRQDIPLADLAIAIPALLTQVQEDMYKRAHDVFQTRLKTVTEWHQLVPTLDAKCIAVIPWCEETSCEDDIKERSSQAYVYFHSSHFASFNLLPFHNLRAEQVDERAPSAGAKSLCIPFDQDRWGKPAVGYKCPACQRPAKRWTLFGRSY